MSVSEVSLFTEVKARLDGETSRVTEMSGIVELFLTEELYPDSQLEIHWLSSFQEAFEKLKALAKKVFEAAGEEEAFESYINVFASRIKIFAASATGVGLKYSAKRARLDVVFNLSSTATPCAPYLCFLAAKPNSLESRADFSHLNTIQDSAKSDHGLCFFSLFKEKLLDDDWCIVDEK